MDLASQFTLIFFFYCYRHHRDLHSFPTRRSSDLYSTVTGQPPASTMNTFATNPVLAQQQADSLNGNALRSLEQFKGRSEEHTSELQSHVNLVCRLLLEKKKKIQ